MRSCRLGRCSRRGLACCVTSSSSSVWREAYSRCLPFASQCRRHRVCVSVKFRRHPGRSCLHCHQHCRLHALDHRYHHHHHHHRCHHHRCHHLQLPWRASRPKSRGYPPPSAPWLRTPCVPVLPQPWGWVTIHSALASPCVAAASWCRRCHPRSPWASLPECSSWPFVSAGIALCVIARMDHWRCHPWRLHCLCPCHCPRHHQQRRRRCDRPRCPPTSICVAIPSCSFSPSSCHRPSLQTLHSPS
mmetsp:Transcript_21659/g.60311  ORF Transcript_21659/g.60311 Transcript_21659/m.60311 type:complete len:245 (-) Transcript_21659:109-843(-)